MEIWWKHGHGVPSTTDLCSREVALAVVRYRKEDYAYERAMDGTAVGPHDIRYQELEPYIPDVRDIVAATVALLMVPRDGPVPDDYVGSCLDMKGALLYPNDLAGSNRVRFRDKCHNVILGIALDEAKTDTGYWVEDPINNRLCSLCKRELSLETFSVSLYVCDPCQ